MGTAVAEERLPGMTTIDPPPSSSDDSIVDGAQWREIRDAAHGDGEAYGRLVQGHQRAIADYMWRFTRNRGEWEELVQDVFVEAYFSLKSFRGNAPLLHWLKKIATRVGYRYWKRRKRQRMEATVPIQSWDAAAPISPDLVEVQQAGTKVHAMLGKLAPRDRLVLTLFYLEGCAVAEIAGLTGWSQTMVKVQTFRARNRLKKLLAEEEGEQ
jgi:RNA polymerase sigma-70 factor (ECF subfamily)